MYEYNEFDNIYICMHGYKKDLDKTVPFIKTVLYIKSTIILKMESNIMWKKDILLVNYY